MVGIEDQMENLNVDEDARITPDEVLTLVEPTPGDPSLGLSVQARQR